MKASKSDLSSVVCVLLLVFVISSCASVNKNIAQKPQWKYLGINATGNIMYVDNNSIVKKKDTISALVKLEIPLKQQEQIKRELQDAAKKESEILHKPVEVQEGMLKAIIDQKSGHFFATAYCSKGYIEFKTNSPVVQKITPVKDSPEEKLFEMLCPKK